MLTEGGQVRVMVEVAVDTGRPGENPVEWDILKTGQVGGADDEARRRVHRARQADSQRPHPVRRHPVFGQRVRNRRDDAVDDVLPPAGRFGRTPKHSFQAAAIIRDRHTQLGAAQIDADEGHWFAAQDSAVIASEAWRAAATSRRQAARR